MDEIYEDIVIIKKKLKYLNCKISKVVPTADTNKTILSLANPLGVYYNMSSAHDNAIYTTTGLVLGGFSQVLINTAIEPTVTGATKTECPLFTPNIDMYLVVNYNGNRVEYFFLEI